jgi:TolB-like protein/class 3 adenylate cyclase/Tfp pilus assembly protein PilF
MSVSFAWRFLLGPRSCSKLPPSQLDVIHVFATVPPKQMVADAKKEIELEIAYVLFIDIVGYSKLVSDEQRRSLEVLNQVVRGAEHFRTAEANNRLITVPSGDGMALVFYNTPEAPVQCALEITSAMKQYPSVKLRMGIHSGPVSGVVDVSNRANIAGAGINIAQRVMDCGDAGHILISKHMAEDLEQYGQWRRHLHDLGECEVKHGVRVSIVNLYTEELGNPEVPQNVRQARRKAGTPESAEKARSGGKRWIAVTAVALLIAALAVGALFWSRHASPGSSKPAPSLPASTPTSVVGTVPEKSIAVLPFENLSDNKDNAFFTDGVQDEILTDLARIADLKVISRTSVMQYKTGVARNLREIGQQLGVAHLLEGSVQRAANKVRVNAQLIDARNDAHLWAQTYDRPVDDVFAIQSEIAKAIADQLQAKLSPNEKNAIEQPPTTDVTAFDLYSRAKNLILSTSFSAIGGQNLNTAVDLLNQALARDPSFFLAQCQLAYAHDNLYFLGHDHTPARLALAEAAVETAVRLRPDAGEAHLARAEHLYRTRLDYDGALAELAIARKTLPNDPHVYELAGYIARRRGDREEGLRNLKRAVELDPRNFFTLQQIALSYLTLQRYSDETAVLDRALSIKPDDVETIVTRAMIPLDRNGNTRPLHQALDEIRTRDSEAIKRVADYWLICALAERDAAAAEAALAALGDNFFGNDAVHLRHDFGEGLIARMVHDDAKARAAFTAARVDQEKRLRDQPDYGPSLCVLAMVDAGLGRKEEALHEGRRAIELLPVEKDSINGPHMIEYFAITAAWVGEKDLACQQLTAALQAKSYGTISYGELKLTPYWDPLRGDPRFEKIVASLAPKN